MTKTSALYVEQFSNWQANVTGPKPSDELLDKVHGLGLRPGLQALACAMSLRPEGVTGKQIIIACGAQQLNRMRGLVAEGMFKWHATPRNAEGHTVYKHTVSPKGEAEIKRLAKIAVNASASTAAPKKAAVKTTTKVTRKVNAATTPQPKAAVAPVAAAHVPGQMPDLPDSLKVKQPQAQASK